MEINKNIIAGLDLGTTKVCVLVGKLSRNGINIVGIGEAPSNGIKKGTIVDIDATVASMKSAISQAELMSGYKITDVFTGIADGQVKSFNDSGMWVLKGGPIVQKDIDKALETTERSVKVESGRCILNIIPQEFVIDGQRTGTKNPLGKSGVRLEPKVHIITASSNSVEDIRRCASKCGVNVREVILEPLASARAVLSEEEKQVGVVMVDIGGGTTDVSIFYDNSIIHSSVIPLAGNHITSDISQVFRILATDAEILKKKYGHAISRMAEREDSFDINTVGTNSSQKISSNLLSEVIQARVEQIFELIGREIKRAENYNRVSYGIVLTGGSSLLRGIKELSEMYFETPVRIGVPRNVGVLKDIVSSPVYSTAMGLVMYGSSYDRPTTGSFDPVKSKGLVEKVKNNVKVFCDEYF